MTSQFFNIEVTEYFYRLAYSEEHKKETTGVYGKLLA